MKKILIILSLLVFTVALAWLAVGLPRIGERLIFKAAPMPGPSGASGNGQVPAPGLSANGRFEPEAGEPGGGQPPSNHLPASPAGPARPAVLVDQAVPFTSQAPFFEWDDPRQQDGCEEAAVLMAVAWARGFGLTRAEARDYILDQAAYEEGEFGEYRDTSAADTAARLLAGYFGYRHYEVRTGFSAADMAAELYAGAVIIVPVNGQAVGNPFYTSPGPDRHMLLVRGFDPAAAEFITNDNGTRHGEAYRYDQDILFSAIRDYPSGRHEPIEGNAKAMIVVRPAGREDRF